MKNTTTAFLLFCAALVLHLPLIYSDDNTKDNKLSYHCKENGKCLIEKLISNVATAKPAKLTKPAKQHRRVKRAFIFSGECPRGQCRVYHWCVPCSNYYD